MWVAVKLGGRRMVEESSRGAKTKTRRTAWMSPNIRGQSRKGERTSGCDVPDEDLVAFLSEPEELLSKDEDLDKRRLCRGGLVDVNL